jgi:Tfp pilus assembly protein PilF
MVMNNDTSRFLFTLIVTMLFSYCCGRQQNRDDKNAGELLTISIAMAMQRYDAGHIS